MTAHLYVLLQKGHTLAEEYFPVWGASKLNVATERDWYTTRERCIQHAIDNGHSKIIICAGTVQLFHRPHWNGHGEPDVQYRMPENPQKGMWLYLDRLLNRFGHVYVPPLSACRSWESLKKRPWTYYNCPVIPMVAGYQTKALSELSRLDLPFGKMLCRAGYDSLTVSDYFYHNHGYDVLDEPGTVDSWSKAYEHAIDSFIEPHP